MRHQRSGRARRRWAWGRGAPGLLLLAAGLVLILTPAAQETPPEPSATDPAAAELERCQQRADSLDAARQRLIARAGRLRAQRDAALERGDEGAMRLLLAREEALADSIRALTAVWMMQQVLCQELGGVPPLRAEFPLPGLREDDPPLILRQKAAYARDLIDRIDGWLELINRVRGRLAEERLAAEARRLVTDEALLDDGSVLGIGGGDALGLAEVQPAAPGLLETVMRETPGMVDLVRPEDVLNALEEWLSTRREELGERATELEEEAVRREREP